LKRDYVRVSPIPNAAAALPLVDTWMEDYNPASQHPSVYAIEENRFC
jgi:putative transposase